MKSTFARRLKAVLPERLVARLQSIDHWFNGEPELRLVARLCAADKTAIDIGANIGTYTCLMRKYARDVVAYEPNQKLAERLSRLYPDVKVRNAAVSDRNGRVVLAMPVAGDNPRHELASISQHFDASVNAVHFEVDAVRLDDESLDAIGFLKIDAEQHEREVLMGALETIRRWRPIIMTETTPLLYKDGLLAQFRFLTDLNYTGWFTFMNGLLSFAQFDPAKHANPTRFGTPEFMNPNVFFFPADIDARQILGR